jgi:hypothetical protein
MLPLRLLQEVPCAQPEPPVAATARSLSCLSVPSLQEAHQGSMYPCLGLPFMLALWGYLGVDGLEEREVGAGVVCWREGGGGHAHVHAHVPAHHPA